MMDEERGKSRTGEIEDRGIETRQIESRGPGKSGIGESLTAGIEETLTAPLPFA